MKAFAVLVAALALLAGFAGGLRAYSAAAPTAAAVPAAAPHHAKAMPVKPGPTFRWAPCQKPAVRHGRACVTTVTRTVTIPAPVVTVPAPAPAAAPVRTAPTRHPSSPSHPASQPTYHDGGGHDGGEHDGGGGGHDD